MSLGNVRRGSRATSSSSSDLFKTPPAKRMAVDQPGSTIGAAAQQLLLLPNLLPQKNTPPKAPQLTPQVSATKTRAASASKSAKTLGGRHQNMTPGKPATVPDRPIVVVEKLPSHYIPLAIQHKTIVAIAGIHLLVHSVNGPSKSVALNIGADDYTLPFQSRNMPHLLRCVNGSTGQFECYDPEESLDRNGDTLVSQAEIQLAHWLDASNKSIINLLQGENGDYETTSWRTCYTINLDPSYTLLEDDIPSTANAQDATNKYIELVEKTSETGFANIMQIIKDLSLVKGADYDVVNKGEDAGNVPESARDAILFFANHMYENAEFMKRVCKSKLFLSSIYNFAKMQLTSLMSTFEPSITNDASNRHFFVQVIGFASKQEWESNGFDYGHHASRDAALALWATRVSTSATMPMPVSGVYFIQHKPLPCIAEIRIIETATGRKTFTANQFLGELIPIVATELPIVDLLQVPPGYGYVLSNSSFVAKYMSGGDRLTKIHARRYRENFVNIHDRTRLPSCFWYMACLSSPYPQFRLDEFQWVAAQKRGAGGFGYVLKVDWSSKTVVNQGIKGPSDHLLRHAAMVEDVLTRQLQIVVRAANYRRRGAEYAAEELLENDRHASIQSIEFQLWLGVAPDGQNILGYLDLPLDANGSNVKMHLLALEFVKISLYANGSAIAPRDLIQKLKSLAVNDAEVLQWPEDNVHVINFSTRVAASLVTKLSIRSSIGMLQEATLAEILGGQVARPNLDLRYYNPITGEIEEEYLNDRVPALIGQDVISAFKKDAGLALVLPINAPTSVGQYTVEYASVPIFDPQFTATLDPVLVASLEEPSTMPALGPWQILPCYGRCFDGPNVIQVLPDEHYGSLASMMQKTVSKVVPWVGDVTINDIPNVLALRLQYDNAPRPPSLYEVVSITLDAFVATNHLNSTAMCHSDIKADNILVSADRRGYLADMGVSRPYGTGTGGSGTPRVQPYAFVSSPNKIYFYPICSWFDSYCLGSTLDWRYDIYSSVNLKVHSPPYLDTAQLSYVGTCFNARMSELVVGTEFAPILQSSLTRYTNDGSKIPYSQLPVSRNVATQVLQTLRFIASKLRNKEMVDKALSYMDAIANRGSTPLEQVLSRQEPISNLVDGSVDSPLNGNNQLRMAEALLRVCLLVIESDVRANWGDFVA